MPKCEFILNSGSLQEKGKDFLVLT